MTACDDVSDADEDLFHVQDELASHMMRLDNDALVSNRKREVTRSMMFCNSSDRSNNTAWMHSSNMCGGTKLATRKITTANTRPRLSG